MEKYKNILERAVKTFFQTFGGCLTVELGISQIDWKEALFVSLVAMIYSFYTSFVTIDNEGNSIITKKKGE